MLWIAMPSPKSPLPVQPRKQTASLRRSVPSMNALATFEAAARLSSFTQAAAELGVTQAAVSRQIRLLEDDFNATLFLRAHRRVVLTPAGQALAQTVTGAFASMAEMIETIRRPRAEDTVSIGATLAFSHFWFVPRLARFRAAHPGIKLKLVAEDGPTDLRRDRLDMAIRFGKPPFPDARSVASAPDTVFPVCSPRLLHAHGMTAETANLLRLPLIASDTVNPTWLSWRTWAQALGLGPGIGQASDRSGLRFNHYTDTIQAAVNGEGVALGWGVLIAEHLKDGRLVRLGGDTLSLEERYHVLVPLGRAPAGPAAMFLDWLTGEFPAG